MHISLESDYMPLHMIPEYTRNLIHHSGEWDQMRYIRTFVLNNKDAELPNILGINAVLPNILPLQAC